MKLEFKNCLKQRDLIDNAFYVNNNEIAGSGNGCSAKM